MAFGTMITIFCTWGLQSIDVAIHPLPTALIAMPIGILGTILLLLLLEKAFTNTTGSAKLVQLPYSLYLLV